MECEVKEILKLFMHTQTNLSELLNEDIESIYEELSDQDEVNEAITDCLTAMTKRMNDIESRLNKLEKEKRRNATNK